MQKSRFIKGLVALAAASSLLLAGCASNSNSGGDSKAHEIPASEVDSGAIITTNGSNPQNPLIPSNTSEQGGGRIVHLLFSSLTYHDENAKEQYDIAESIETKDNINYTVKIKKDAAFSDGTPTKAKDFVDTWNFAANLDNKQAKRNFFEDIKGFEKDKPVAKLEGLKVVDDHTFTIELKAPVIYFKQRLGDPAYAPLPEVAFKDLKKYGEAPIGNGRYKLKDGKGIDPNKGVTVVKNENYRGTRAIKNGGIEVKFYVSDNAAYADAQAGNLDVLDKIPSKDLANLKTDFPDRSISKPNATFSSVAIPYYLEGFQGEEGKLRRRAISYAIDRQVIIKNVFNDTLKPAKDFTSSVLPGFNDKIKGSEVLAYDKKKAKELWEQANKIAPWPADRKFEIAFNADASHQPWVTAVSNDIKNSLGIEVGTKPIPLFADFLKQIKAKSIGSAFRTTWGPDFPSPASYLPQLYGNGGSGNQSQHNNPEFDKILDDAKKAKTAEDAVKTYEKAQELLFRDLPVVPLWNGSSNAVWSDKVSNVKFGFTGGAFYSDIVKKKK